MITGDGGGGITYWLAEHPVVVGFRWSPAHTWGSTWWFLFSSLSLYLAAAISLHLILLLFRRRRPLPLGPLPALHSLLMSLSSAAIFLGILLSAAAEIRDTRWFWLNRRAAALSHPLQWLLCFPPGTRPSGRVFFWSYAFYLSRFLHLLRSFFLVARRRVGGPRSPSLPHLLFSHVTPVGMAFVWLEFSQSVQVVGILSATLAAAVADGYRFWVGVGLPRQRGGGVAAVLGGGQSVLLGGYLLSHVGVLPLHLWKGGCNGIGAWAFNSVLNGGLLLLFTAEGSRGSRSWWGIADDGGSTHHRHQAASFGDVVKKEQ